MFKKMCFCCFSITYLFFLQVEENSTEDKSKDSAPLDSQSEGTNYFLQYISTPRWWSSVLFWVFFGISSSFTVSFDQLIPLVSPLSFQFKKCHKQYRQWGKICFWAEHVRTSFGKLTQPVKECTFCHNLIQLWTASKVVLCCAFRVPRRASPPMRKIKTFQLPPLQSPHHRKPPQRRVRTQGRND